MSKDTNQEIFDSSNLITFLLAWKKPLIIVTVAAAILSAIVSLIIEPKFKSTVILYPATTNSLAKALFSEDPQGKQDVLQFGEEEEAEQLIQILNSDEIREKITNKYNLLKHYEIEDDEEYKNTKLIEEYEDNISFKRTEFQSVRIDVMDKNPDTAAMIANDIASYLDSVKNRMQKERAIEAYKIIEREYSELTTKIKVITDSMSILRKKGVLNYNSQIEMLTEQYAVAILKNNVKAAKLLQQKLDTIAKYGGAYIELENQYWLNSEKSSELGFKYKEAKVDVNENMPHKFIVNKAFPAEKKSYPVRWLIVVIATLATFLLAIITIIGIENFKKFQSK